MLRDVLWDVTSQTFKQKVQDVQEKNAWKI